MDNEAIKIAADFNPKLGGRWKKLGPYSGEEFFEKLLEQKFLEVIKSNKKLEVFLDGTKGYGSSFLDQSFGELARKYGLQIVKSTLIFHTVDFKWVIEFIENEIWKSDE